MRRMWVRAEWRVALLYASFGGLWILFSDRVLLALTDNLDTLSRMQTYKGWVFVLASAVLLFILLRRELNVRTRTEADLQASEKRYRLISENSTDVIWTLDPATERFTYVSPSVFTLRGLTAEEVIVEPMQAALTPESYRMISELMPIRVAAFQAGDLSLRTATTEVDQTRKDGSVVATEVVTTLLTDAEGHVVEILGITRDITERKQAQAELQRSEKKYRTLVETAEDVILLSDLQGKHLYRNTAYYASLGFEVDEDVDLDGYTRVHPDDLGRMPVILDRLKREGTATNEYRVRHKNGHWIYRQAKIVTLYDERHQPEAFLSIIRDITHRKLAEEKLRESEERYRQLLEFSPIGIAVHADRKVVFTNPAGAAIIGASDPAEMVGKPITEIIHPDDQAKTMERLQRLLAGETGLYPTEDRYIRLDGQEVPVEVIAVPLNYNGQPAIQVIVQDITKRKQAEARINCQVNRLKALHLVDLAISSSFDLSIVFQTVLQQVEAQLNADACAILMLNSKLHLLEYATSRGYPFQVYPARPLHLGDSNAGRVVLARKPVHLSAAREGQSALRLANETFQEYLGIPLIVKGEIKGVLEIYQRGSLRNDPELMDFLETLAGQIAIAIQNVELFKSWQQTNSLF